MVRLAGNLAGEFRLAVRALTHRPGFTAVALLTLALGIGAPTAVFSVLDAVLLRPLPYPDADRVITLGAETRGPQGPVAFDAIPAAAAGIWALDTATLSHLSLYTDRALTLSTDDGPFRLSGAAVSPNLFELLAVAPAAGRVFEGSTTDAKQVVLSDTTWRQFFAARGDIVGRAIPLDGEAYRVVAVMPREFQFPSSETGFWTPLLLVPNEGRGMLLPGIARLRRSADMAAALEEGSRFLADATNSRSEMTLRARTLEEQLLGGTRRLLWVLMGAVAGVSVVATSNLALLLLVRGAARRRELAIRVAVGAGRGRLLRGLVVEALTLAAVGGMLGLLLAGALMTVMVNLAPPDMPRLRDVALDARVLAFSVSLTVVSSVVFAALSAGRTLAIDSVRTLGSARPEQTPLLTAVPRRRLQSLAAAELAVTLVLLTGAGLLVRSLIGLVLIDHGFDPDNAVAVQVTMPSVRYPTPEDRLAFQARLLDRVQSIPAITAAGIAVSLPHRQPTARYDFDPTGIPVLDDAFARQVAEVRSVSPGFFEAMGVPLLAGRTFTETDREGTEPVVVIARSLANQHFPQGDALGRLLHSRSGTRRVVGVVGDVRPAFQSPQHAPSAYLPIRQSDGVFRWFASLNIVVRGGNASAMAATLRSIVLSLDPDMPPFNLRTLDAELSRLVARPRFGAVALSAFAAIALLLAAIGVYGVMACSAAQRTREIGIRVALGATRAQVLRMMMRDALIVAGGGIVAGALLALWMTRALTGLLYEVHPADPQALFIVAALLGAVALLAAYVPARRAVRSDAMTVLRAD